MRKLINAWGTATGFGVSRSHPDVGDAVADALGRYFVMSELQAACGLRLAGWAGAEAACVTHCASAAVTLAVAACMTGRDPRRIAQLPDASGLRSEVLMLDAQRVDYGQPITQAVRLAGARVVACGSTAELAERLAGEAVACVLAVESHLAPGSGSAVTRALSALCAGHVPLVVDAAAQDRRAREVLRSGADLVLLSAQKYLAAPTAGIVLGRAALVAAVDAQHQGIGRGMKPSKEALAGVMAALDVREREEPGLRRLEERIKVQQLVEAAAAWAGASARVEDDPLGNDMARVWVAVDEAVAGVTAARLAARLLEGETAVAVAPHRLAQGELGFELTGVRLDEMPALCRLVEEAFAGG